MIEAQKDERVGHPSDVIVIVMKIYEVSTKLLNGEMVTLLWTNKKKIVNNSSTF